MRRQSSVFVLKTSVFGTISLTILVFSGIFWCLRPVRCPFFYSFYVFIYFSTSTLTGEEMKKKQVLLNFLKEIRNLTNRFLSYFQHKSIVINYLHFHCRISSDERSTVDWNRILWTEMFQILHTLSMTLYNPYFQFLIKSVHYLNFCILFLINLLSLLNFSQIHLCSIM